MDQQKRSDLQATYDAVAEEYVRRIYDELAHKPLDRQLLDALAYRLQGRGIICDMGCGPGHVARYLHERGAEVGGVDLSPGMVERARRLNPGIDFQQGDLCALTNIPEEAWAGIVAFYSLIHVPREETVPALRELRRTLQPGGLLLMAFHIGDAVVHLEEWWDYPVAADFVFFRSAEMAGGLKAAGFEVENIVERPPYPNVEHPSQRAYIMARKAA